MTRPIKFRAWEKHLKQMIPVDSIDFVHRQINTDSAWRFFEEIELMQFTGLLDRFDREIYEGDIVKATSSDNKYLSIVEWHNGEGRWGFKAIPSKTMPYNYNLTFGCSGWEIVGNIYENPELLK